MNKLYGRNPTTNRLSQIQRTLQQRNILKNNFQANKLMNLGLYEKAAELQKLTTEAISKSSDFNREAQEKLASKLELVKKTIENEGELTRHTQQQNHAIVSNSNESDNSFTNVIPLDKHQEYDNKYVLIENKKYF